MGKNSQRQVSFAGGCVRTLMEPYLRCEAIERQESGQISKPARAVVRLQHQTRKGEQSQETLRKFKWGTLQAG